MTKTADTTQSRISSGGRTPMPSSTFDNLPDEDLFDMGMVRCGCGAAFYPPGGGVVHCEKGA